MGRSGKGESKKDLILQTALKLFSKNGYHATTTKEIATESGVAEGLIFYYFGGKEELLRSVVRSFSFVEQVREQAAEWQNLSGKEALTQFGRMYLAFLERYRDYLLLIWSPELLGNQEVTTEVKKLILGMAEEGGRLIAIATSGSKKPLPPFTTQVAVSMLLSSLLTYFIVSERSKDRTLESDEAYIQETVEIVLDGVLHKEPK